MARGVAQLLGWDWVDSDDQIEQRAGMTIAEVFAQRGEPGFRDLEQEVIAQLSEADRTVIALGGGAVLREATRELLQRSGVVVWLTAPAETLAARITADAASADRRPSLTGLPPREEVRRLLAEREPLYRECATFTVETEQRSLDEIAELIPSRITSP